MADLTSGRIPYATGSAQIDDTTFDFAADQIVATASLSSVIGAAIVNAGTGGTPGAAVVTTTTGTGTPAQVGVTIGAGGDIESIDSIDVAGAFSVPPTDPSAEPVTGGGLTGATLNLGLAFAPVIVGSDPASGLSFNTLGEPALSLSFPSYPATLILTVSQNADDQFDPGFLFESDDGYPLVVLRPTIGKNGGSTINLFGNGSQLYTTHYNGVTRAPLPTLNNNSLFQLGIQGTKPDLGAAFGTLVLSRAAGNATSSGVPSTYEVSTFHVGGSLQQRLVIDGSGNTNILNGGLVVGTPTGGSQGAGSVNTEELFIATSITPAGPTATGVAGQVGWDASFIYVCVATDTWIRCAKDVTWV